MIFIMKGFEYMEGDNRVLVKELTEDRVYFVYQDDILKTVYTEIYSVAEDDWREIDE